MTNQAIYALHGTRADSDWNGFPAEVILGAGAATPTLRGTIRKNGLDGRELRRRYDHLEIYEYASAADAELDRGEPVDFWDR